MTRWIQHLLVPGLKPSAPGEQARTYLSFDHLWPTWVLILVAFATVALVAWLYRREGRLAPRHAKVVLACLRISLVWLAVFLLQDPSVSVDRSEMRSSYVCVLVDDSRSMNHQDRYADTVDRGRLTAMGFPPDAHPRRLQVAKTVLAQDNAKLLRGLARDHQVRLYAVSTAVRLLGQASAVEHVPALVPLLGAVRAQGQETQLGTAIRTCIDDLRGKTLAGVVLLSDGHVTAGDTLAQAGDYARHQGVRLFPVGIGDPSARTDSQVRLRDVLVDDKVYLGDRVTFHVQLTSQGMKGRRVRLQLGRSPDDQPVAQKTITLGPDGQEQDAALTVLPRRKGTHQFVLEVLPLRPGSDQPERHVLGPHTRRHLRVQVIDQAIRVLYLESYPRYEYRYLKALLVRDKAVNVSCLLMDADSDFPQEGNTPIRSLPTTLDALNRFDVVLFGDVNPIYLSGDQLAMLVRFVKQGGGLMMIAGQRFAPYAYRATPLAEILPVELGAGPPVGDAARAYDQEFRPRLTPEAQTSPIFRFSDDPAENRKVWDNLPGFYWYCPTRGHKPGAVVLAEHPSARGPDGFLPIVFTQFFGAGRCTFQAVDSTWRWRYRVEDQFFAPYWIQTIRFLARARLLGQSRQATISTLHDRFVLGQGVRVEVVFLDKSLRPQPGRPASAYAELREAQHAVLQREIVLKADTRRPDRFVGVFKPTRAGAYTVWIGAGMDRAQSPKTTFTVHPPKGELQHVPMELARLQRLAQQTHGHYLSIHQAHRCPDLLEGGQQIVLHTERISLWDLEPLLWTVLAVFSLLLITEWVLRKRYRML